MDYFTSSIFYELEITLESGIGPDISMSKYYNFTMILLIMS